MKTFVRVSLRRTEQDHQDEGLFWYVYGVDRSIVSVLKDLECIST